MRSKRKTCKAVKQTGFENEPGKGVEVLHVEIHEKGPAGPLEEAHNRFLQWADSYHDLCAAGEEEFQRDMTISRLEAELSSVKKENDDLRELCDAALDQAHHMIAQLEAQNAYYADVISADRDTAAKMTTQLYHTVSLLLTVAPTLPLASEDELVLKFACCLPVGEANAKALGSVWSQCEDTLFPLGWLQHYSPIHGAPQLFLDRHPETFFRRADGAYYLRTPAAPMKPLPPPCDIRAMPDSRWLASSEGQSGCPTPPEGESGRPAPPAGETGGPAFPEGQRPAALPDVSPAGDILARPLPAQPVSQGNADSLAPWFPNLRSEHQDIVPPMPKGAPSEPLQRGPNRNAGHGPHPSSPRGMVARLPHPAPLTRPPHPTFVAVTPPAPPRDSRPPVPRQPAAKVASSWAPRKPRNAAAAISVPKTCPLERGSGDGASRSSVGGGQQAVAPPRPQVLVVTPPAPPRDSRPPVTRPPAAKVASTWVTPKHPAATASVASSGVKPTNAAATASVASSGVKPNKAAATVSVASSGVTLRKAAATTSVSSKRGPNSCPGESVENGASRASRSPASMDSANAAATVSVAGNGVMLSKAAATGSVSSKRGPTSCPGESVENSASRASRSPASMDSASHASTVVGAQAVGAPRRLVPVGEGLLSTAGLSRSAWKRLKRRAAKSA